AAIPPLSAGQARADHLAGLARRAMARLPGFYWIADGRTPWQVFHAERLLGKQPGRSLFAHPETPAGRPLAGPPRQSGQ
ncbi:hypothetical protein SOO12_14255, partial [Staphylococcus aureus]